MKAQLEDGSSLAVEVEGGSLAYSSVKVTTLAAAATVWVKTKRDGNCDVQVNVDGEWWRPISEADEP